nr:ribonuclease H-like domain-containing protein [Tanacetum cinerariifolium]
MISNTLQKSVKNSDLNVQLQEKVFAIAALKNELRKLKGKNVVDTAVSKPIATITPRIFKLDIEPISHRLKNNRDAHEHQILSHLNFDYITSFAKQGLVRGLLKLMYQKDHFCSACAFGKSKKHSQKPKAKESIQEKLYLLHMDLCSPIRIQSINGRKYILVIVDDYSRFTWVKFLLSKEEVPDIAPEPTVSIGTPSSTIIDQDEPSTSTSQTPSETPSLVIPLSVKEAKHDTEVAHIDNNPFIEFPLQEPSSEESSTQVVIPNHVHLINQLPEHINKWTKDHPIDNVIGDPSRLIST